MIDSRRLAVTRVRWVGRLVVVKYASNVYYTSSMTNVAASIQPGQIGIVLTCKRRYLGTYVVARAAFASGLVGWCYLSRDEVR